MEDLFYKDTLLNDWCSSEDFEKFEKDYSLRISNKTKETYLKLQGLRFNSENNSFIVFDYYNQKHIIGFYGLWDFGSTISQNFHESRKNPENGTSYQNQKNIFIIGTCYVGDAIGVGINLDEFMDKVYYIPFSDPTDFISENDFSLINPSIEIAPDLNTFFSMLGNPENL